jgi:23S rRNA (pseudouridine1915-N3)-methyltransferase
MKITLVAVGKTQVKDLQPSIFEYSKRIAHYASFEFMEVQEDKLAKVLAKFDRVFLLDEKGAEYSSKGFAELIEKQMNAGVKDVAFVIGGPFGLNQEVRELADASVALSKMTFPHDLVRVIFLEQLYRALTILKNENYHHE